ncbi:hypothetical protein HYPSUDRAFT_275252 [Hypholoma sublateritium FD-334 SS-4]|uniref:Uncharacterized protein n=1 Tax=Hypholoma sublateritium (strain FD-334 SS-4) TaxID=945553 RepID=A0A0D2LFN5_HYPSF|nr:hypothetical protein HYPSUDRAFT_275252 [Hypholoma sublateritium FD-334 SS-4]
MDRAQQTVARRVPCYCHKCDGTMVSVRTERNHRKSPRAPDKSRYGKLNGTSHVKKRQRTMASGSKNNESTDETIQEPSQRDHEKEGHDDGEE